MPHMAVQSFLKRLHMNMDEYKSWVKATESDVRVCCFFNNKMIFLKVVLLTAHYPDLGMPIVDSIVIVHPDYSECYLL